MTFSMRTKLLFGGLFPLLVMIASVFLTPLLITAPTLRLTVQLLVAAGSCGLSVILALKLSAAMHNSFKQRVQALQEQVRRGDFRLTLPTWQQDDPAQFAMVAEIFQVLQVELERVLQEMNAVIQAVQAGNLSARGRLENVTGRLQEFVLCQNKLLDFTVVPLTTIAEFIDRLSKGEIPGQLAFSAPGDFSKIFANLNLIREKLSEFTGSIQATAAQIAADSQSVHLISEKIAVDASAQAASTEQISVSMEEIVATIRQTANHAQQTEEFAVKAVAETREAGEAVNQTVKAMHAIAQKSSIIKTIAAQTRMLSLNATIEAATAQEHGRAFAVVASEVRKLADIIKKAAEEIDQLTRASVTVGEQAGERLDKLVPAIQKTAALVQEISAASSEQSIGTDHINRAIQQLVQITHQNAAKAEELAATAAVFAQQAGQLQKVNVFFKIVDAAGESVYAYAAEHHDRERGRDANYSPETSARTAYRVGFVIEGLSNPFLRALKTDVETVAAKYPNITLEVHDGQDDITIQLAELKQLLAQPVDALLIESAQPQMLLPVLEQADALHIPYVCCLKGTNGINAASQVLAGYSFEGKLMGEFIARQFSEGGNFVIIEGIPGDESSILRCQPVRKAIEANPKMKLLASRPGYFRQEPAQKVMQAFLAEFPEIDVVYCANDENALGALTAMRAAGKIGRIQVVGIDAEQTALQAIRSGEMLATATHARGGAYGKTVAAVAMRVLMDYLQGKDVPRWLVSETQLVTKANVAQIESLF